MILLTVFPKLIQSFPEFTT